MLAHVWKIIARRGLRDIHHFYSDGSDGAFMSTVVVFSVLPFVAFVEHSGVSLANNKDGKWEKPA